MGAPPGRHDPDRVNSAAAALRMPTSRELDIVRLVAEGLSNVEIAERLALRQGWIDQA